MNRNFHGRHCQHVVGSLSLSIQLGSKKDQVHSLTSGGRDLVKFIMRLIVDGPELKGGRKTHDREVAQL